MSPELKSNLLLSGVSAVVITFVFYFWSRGDKEPPTVKTHAKLLVSSFGVNFLLFYALNKKMIPASITGCPIMAGGSTSAPWSAPAKVGSASAPQTIANNPAKFTAVDLNEPGF